MSQIIFDIETAGYDFESLDPEAQEYLLKWTRTEEEVTAVKEGLSFYPQTGEIVAIGVLNPDTVKGAVFYQSSPLDSEAFEEEGILYQPGTEAEILKRFWETIDKYDQIVTFNGRSFDSPFILIRTAVHHLYPSRELIPNRYSDDHIDLLDRLTFFGAFRRRFNLDMWCRTFGIVSPKSQGITGYDIKDLFREGRYKEIARYCVGDLFATRELLIKWEQHIKFPPRLSR